MLTGKLFEKVYPNRFYSSLRNSNPLDMPRIAAKQISESQSPDDLSLILNNLVNNRPLRSRAIL